MPTRTTRTTRTNGRSPDAPDESAATPVEPCDTAVSRLHRLAGEGRVGALQVVGRPGGVVYLDAGRIVYAESPATPGVEVAVLRTARPDDAAWAATVTSLRNRSGRRAAVAEAADLVAAGHGLSPVRLDAAVQSATADALLAMLAGYGVTVTRTRFVDGQRPWVGLGRPLTPGAAVDETARRLRLLVAVGERVRSDEDVVRAAAAGSAAVRLSPRQWDLVRLCPGRRTPRDLAWSLGRGVLATTVEVCGLMELGVLGTTSDRRSSGGRGQAGHAARRSFSFLAASVPEAAGRGAP